MKQVLALDKMEECPYIHNLILSYLFESVPGACLGLLKTRKNFSIMIFQFFTVSDSNPFQLLKEHEINA